MEVQPRIDYTLAWRVLAGATLVLLASLYWNRRLSREVAVRQRIAADLRESGARLTEEQARLFQPFGQTASGQQVSGGTGLGLAISRRFVRLMGGELTLDSTPGQGSCFAFTLALPPSDAVAPPPNWPPGWPPCPRPGKPTCGRRWRWGTLIVSPPPWSGFGTAMPHSTRPWPSGPITTTWRPSRACLAPTEARKMCNDRGSRR